MTAVRAEAAARGRFALPSWLPASPAATFLWSRLAIWFGALFASMAFEPKPPPLAATWDYPFLHDVGHVVDIWARWDSAWILIVAEEGYTAKENSAAFFPLYPGLVRLLGRLLADHYLLAGVLISLAAAFGSFVLLYRLAVPRLGVEGAQRAVLYLAVFPTTIFLQAVYTEALFLFLALAAFLLAERGRLAGAALAAGLAMLTRAIGVALLPALAVYAWRSRDRRRGFAKLLLAPALFSAYPLFLWWRLGDPFAFVDAQRRGWGRQSTVLGPLEGVKDGVREGVPAVGDLLDDDAPSTGVARGLYSFDIPSVNLQSLLFLALFLLLTAVAFRRLPRPDFAYALASMVFLLAAVSPDAWPLLGLPRYGLVVFPFFFALAALGSRRGVHNAIVGVSAILLGITVVQWALFQWVA